MTSRLVTGRGLGRQKHFVHTVLIANTTFTTVSGHLPLLVSRLLARGAALSSVGGIVSDMVPNTFSIRGGLLRLLRGRSNLRASISYDAPLARRDLSEGSNRSRAEEGTRGVFKSS